MFKWIQDTFQLTEEGSHKIVKATIASLVRTLFSMVPVLFILFFIHQMLFSQTVGYVVYWLIFAAMVVSLFIILYVDYNATYTTTYAESTNLRIALARRLKELPLSYFSRHDLSDLSQTIMQDVADIETAISHAIAQSFAFVLALVLIALALFVGNVWMGLAVVLPLTVSVILYYFSTRSQVESSTEYFFLLRRNSELFQQAIEMHQEINSYNRKDRIAQELSEAITEREKGQIKVSFVQFVSLLVAGSLNTITVGVTLLCGIFLYKAGSLSLLYLIGYLLASASLVDQMLHLELVFSMLLYMKARINRIRSINETPIQNGEPVKLNNFSLTFEDVSFGYNDQTRVLDKVSFTAEQNKVTALVGPSGCGKTSVLRLASRLYDYDSGKISIDGRDIKTIDTESLFSHISIVFQEVTLFNTSVLENIRIGRKDASDEAVKEAARMANCEEFINNLPDGYDTLIGENGSKLSGGQRQRLSIARAFLKNAEIILLDEISASLDVENEMKIQDSLNKLIKNKTVIIVSHRLKSVEQADSIVVFNAGKIEAVGTHQYLREHSQTYQNMIEKSQRAEDFIY